MKHVMEARNKSRVQRDQLDDLIVTGCVVISVLGMCALLTLAGWLAVSVPIAIRAAANFEGVL